MGLIFDLLRVLFEIIYALLIRMGHFILPILLGLMIIAVFKKKSIWIFIGLTVLSSLFNIIIWFFPTGTELLASGNMLLNVATITNFIDLFLFQVMSSWGIAVDLLIVGISMVASTVYIYSLK